MANKRSKRNQSAKFYCPYCGDRLWRLGTGKHHLYFQGISEIQQQFNLTRKKASLLAGQNPVQTDRATWLEEFMCRSDGKFWLYLSKQKDGSFVTKIADDSHWKRSSKTIDPNHPNPSVSEFTYRMSRKSTRI